MSLFSALRSLFTAASRAQEVPAAGARPPGEIPTGESIPDALATEAPSALRRLKQLGTPGGPGASEAVAILREARGTVHEAEVVSEALGGAGRVVGSELISIAAADLLAERGDSRAAVRILEGISTTPALTLLADLYATMGRFELAVTTIERVLATDLEAPGATERHARWSRALGYEYKPLRAGDSGATLMTAEPDRAPFVLLREAARGGGGAVYEAEDPHLHRRVAFKVYHGRGKDRPLVEREVAGLVAVAGAGILRLHDADPPSGWLALEWVPGGSIQHAIELGSLQALAPIRRWAVPLARALGRVHAAGIVHGDVKPANVLLRCADDPVLADFAVAAPFGAKLGGGSPGYVRAERIAGRVADPRDDVYGYGRILEDVLRALDRFGGRAITDDIGTCGELVRRCLSSAEDQPKDGQQLVEWPW